MSPSDDIVHNIDSPCQVLHMDKETGSRGRCPNPFSGFRWFIALMFLMVGWLAALLGIFAASNQPSGPSILEASPRQDAYYLQLRRQVITNIYNNRYDPTIFLKPYSPQRRAMEWMAYKDVSPVPLNETWEDLGHYEPNFRWIQRYALLVLYFAGHGDTWEVKTTEAIISTEAPHDSLSGDAGAWTTGAGQTSECDWQLIECNPYQQVISLQLGQNGVTMTGLLPREIGLLTHIKHLSLASNRLKGGPPEELFQLSLLETLDLSENQFSTSLSTEVGHLTNLKVLHLNENDFSGYLPMTMQRLTLLEDLDCSFNPRLRGPAMEYGVHWPNIKSIVLTETQTSGTIPTEIGNLVLLEQLNILRTSLFGTIPREIGRTPMRSLVSGSSQLVGSLPTEIGLWKQSLTVLIINESLMSGTIPTEIGLCTELVSFMFQDSPALEGTIPSEFGLLTDLEILHLKFTALEGTVPSQIGQLTALDHLWLHVTHLTGKVPEQICALRRVEIYADCATDNGNLAAEISCDCCTDCQSF